MRAEQGKQGRPGDAVPTAPAFRMWIWRDDEDPPICAVRFQVERGKGMLRVTRPGVLIVPPARVHGHEEHLTPGQLRQSQFLHIPGGGRPRVVYRLDQLEDEHLLGMDPETWTELEATQVDGGHFLRVRRDQGVLALAGDSPSALDAPDADALLRVAGIVEVMRSRPLLQDEPFDDVLETDPMSYASSDLPSAGSESHSYARALNGAYSGEIPPVGDEDSEDAPSMPSRPLPTEPPVHFEARVREDVEDHPSEPWVVRLPGAIEEDPTDVQDPAATLESDLLEAESASMHRAADAPPPSSAQQSAAEEPEWYPDAGHDRFIVRHLRWELDRRDLELTELRGRVERLEARLRALGQDPSQD